MTKIKIPIEIRQGDVLLEFVPGIPANAIEMEPDAERGHVLADGEVTGHSHRVPARYAGNAARFRTEEDLQFLRVTAPVPLRHEEHKTVCALCPEQKVGDPMPLATHRMADGYTREDYRCEKHTAADTMSQIVVLAEPGATDIPPGQWRRTIHLEYVPRDVPRRVED